MQLLKSILSKICGYSNFKAKLAEVLAWSRFHGTLKINLLLVYLKLHTYRYEQFETKKVWKAKQLNLSSSYMGVKEKFDDTKNSMNANLWYKGFDNTSTAHSRKSQVPQVEVTSGNSAISLRMDANYSNIGTMSFMRNIIKIGTLKTKQTFFYKQYHRYTDIFESSSSDVCLGDNVIFDITIEEQTVHASKFRTYVQRLLSLRLIR